MKRIQFLSLLFVAHCFAVRCRDSGYERYLGPDRRSV